MLHPRHFFPLLLAYVDSSHYTLSMTGKSTRSKTAAAAAASATDTNLVATNKGVLFNSLCVLQFHVSLLQLLLRQALHQQQLP